jgi:AcrR family transcriptional regulator
VAGRPPIVENRVAILEATRGVLADVGYEQLTFEAVAQRADLYRRLINRSWASKAELVRDALFNDVPLFATPDTGSLDGDLELLLGQQADVMMRPEFMRGMPSLQVALQTDPELWTDTYARHVEPLEEAVGLVLERAEARGEISDPPGAAIVLSFANGAMQQAGQRGLLRREELVKQVVRLLTRGVLSNGHT